MTLFRTPIKILGATAGIALIAAALPVATAGPASADATSHGSCSSGSLWDFDVEHDDGGYEVSFEVDSNRPGERWTLQLTQNGQRFFTGVRITDREGEADVETGLVKKADGSSICGTPCPR